MRVSTTDYLQSGDITQPTIIPITASAYDTAVGVMACAGKMDAEDLVARWRSWLGEHQLHDGSWGSARFEPHDRLVNTLAAMVALGPGHPAVDRGLRYLNDIIPQLRAIIAETPGAQESVAFELVVPELARRAAGLGLPLPYDDLKWINDMGRHKLALVPPGALAHTTLAHTFEAIESTEVELSTLVGADGSIGCSPAAAAHAYGRWCDPTILRFLRSAAAATGDGGLPTIYPYELFDQCWVLYYLALGGLPTEQLHPAVVALSRRCGPEGLAMAAHGVPADADDTAVLLWLRHSCGLPTALDVLDRFDTGHGYATYSYERTASASTNIHVLLALRTRPEIAAERIERTVAAIRLARVNGAYWMDKWHLSPYYATSAAIVALVGVADDMHREAVEWIIDTQHPDGSWGLAAGSCEETANVVLALMSGPANKPEAVHAGMAYLRRNRYVEPLPDLWIGKVLYCPQRVVRAAIEAAHLRYDIWASDRP